MLQGNQLTMLALGNATTPGFGLGIHARWHFKAALGWPRFGFVLHRRPAEKGVRVCVDFLKITFADRKRTRFTSDSGSAGVLTAVSTASMTVHAGPPSGLTTSSKATFTFELAKPVRQFSLSVMCASGTMRLEAYDGEILVASASRGARGSAATMVVLADRITRVTFEAPTAAAIGSICRIPISDGDWTRLTQLDLPRDWATADGRLPSSLSAGMRQRFKRAWPRLEKVIGKVKHGILSESLGERSGADAAPTLEANYIHLLQAAALDPNVARMIGLYFLDESAATGVHYDYKIAGHWSGARVADHAWICFSVARGALPAVTRPSGLATEQVEVPGGIAGVRDSQVATALGWTIARSANGQLAQTAPVMYHVFREDRKPDGSWTAEKNLTEARPVIAKATANNPRYYTDGPLAVGAYRYKIAGVDIFGRQSAMSATSTLTLADTVAPPPPIMVRAALADPDDTTPVDIQVSWSWTSKQREQAGDATTFRVYHQYENLYPVAGAVLGAAAGGAAETSDLTTDLDPAADYSRFTDGYLFQLGARYKVIGVRLSAGEVVITVENNEDASRARTVAPAAATLSTSSFSYLAFLTDAWKMKGRFLLKTDWSSAANWQAAYETKNLTAAEDYSATIADVPVTVDSATPTATIMVAVCTEDANGNVGALSVPVTVQVRNVIAPSAPTLAIAADEYASRADWYGNSQYTIALPAAGPGVRYEILRTTDAGLANAVGSSAGLSEISDEDLRGWADETDADDPGKLAYRTAFMNVGTATGDFEDEFPGMGRNRYVYKVRSIDSANNRGEFAGAAVVHLHDVMPPNTPIVTSVVGGNGEITLGWARNTEADIAGYRVYLTMLAESATDIRSMGMAGEIAAGTETHVDMVEVLTNYYFRLVAYDTAGNVSRPSNVLRGKAYDATLPAPPAWLTHSWDAGGSLVSLEWTLGDASHSSRVQRRKLGSDTWQSISSSWLPEGASSATDTTATTADSYVYRISVKGRNGLTNDEFEEVTVTYAP